MPEEDVLLESMEDDVSGGKRLGPCVLWTRVGSGGMGTVYVGDHDRWGKDVAIKVLPVTLRLSDPDYDARFYREAKAAQSIKDRRIVRVYEVGEAAPHLYMVMEYVGGGTLRKKIEKRGGRLPLKETLEIMKEAASAIYSAHDAGVLHRDIKPDNIMFTNGGEIRIADFGLAKIVETGVGLTQTMASVGTPRYMAPEQCEDAGRVDERADIYALGVVTYEALAGRPPYDGETPSEILFHVARGGCKKLEEYEDFDIPKPVSDFVDSLISIDPNERPGSAREAAEGMREMLRMLENAGRGRIEEVRRPEGTGKRKHVPITRESARGEHEPGKGRPIEEPSEHSSQDSYRMGSRRVEEVREPVDAVYEERSERSSHRSPAPMFSPAPPASSRRGPGTKKVLSVREIFKGSGSDDPAARAGKIVMYVIFGIVGLMFLLGCLGTILSALL